MARKKSYQREIHYHQHLNAGENTLNLQLSAELYRQIILNSEFSIDHWLHRYVEVMLQFRLAQRYLH